MLRETHGIGVICGLSPAAFEKVASYRQPIQGGIKFVTLVGGVWILFS